MVLKLDIGSTNGKIVLHRQTAHADTVAGILARLVYSERLSQCGRLDCRLS